VVDKKSISLVLPKPIESKAFLPAVGPPQFLGKVFAEQEIVGLGRISGWNMKDKVLEKLGAGMANP